MEEHNKSIGEYTAVIKQKKWTVMAITSVILAIAITTAIVWPPTYRSSATILIEQQDIPYELISSTVTSYAAERIQIIQAQVMSRANLLKIIEKFDLYADERKVKTPAEVIEYMREDTALNIISAEVIDPRTGRPGQATIAFELSYDGEQPQSVQRVTSELTSLYMSENLKSRSLKAEEASNFLNEESARLGQQISELEQTLAEFKEENSDLLPGLQPLNMQMLQRLEGEHTVLVSNIQSIKEKKFYYEDQLASLGTDSPESADRLRLLEAEYLSSKARYSADHPDVKKLQREIDALKDQPVLADADASLDDESKKLRLELLQLKERYSDTHPDVVRVKEKLDSLKNKLIDDPESFEDKRKSDPAYSTMKNQIESLAIELRLAEEQKRITKDKMTKLESMLIAAPQVEREYLKLTRDYENAVMRYQDIKGKGMLADVARQLEVENKGERFTLIDPPVLPEKPIKPNRIAIIFIGFILAIGGSIGFVLVSDLVAGVMRSSKSIEGLLGVAPLSVIPLHLNASDILERSRFKKRTILVFIIIIIAITAIVHFFVSPIDVIWFRIMRKWDGIVV